MFKTTHARIVLLGLLVANVGCVPKSPAPPVAAGSASGEREPAASAECPRPSAFGPVFVSKEKYQSRTGSDAKTFATLVTTKDRPMEECGIPAVLEKLAWFGCNDGTNPFGGKSRAAHASRRGSVGPGGRCHSIIDVYEVRCPETMYEVFADSYVCEQE
jgi:hypothetical protein